MAAKVLPLRKAMCGTAEARLMSDTPSDAYVIDEDYTIVSFNDTIKGLYPPARGWREMPQAPYGSRRALSALPGCQPRLWPAHRRRVAQAARADPRYGREGPAGRFWQRILVAWHGRQLPVRRREDRQVLRRRDRGQDDGARRNRLDNRDVPPHRHEDGRRGRRDARSSRSTSSTWST